MKTRYRQALRAIQAGDFEAAIAQLDELLETHSDQPELWQALATALLSLERTAGAIAAIGQAIRLDPDLAAAHRLLGKAHRILGNYENAITAYKQATRCYLAQQNKISAQDCLNQIDQLRSEASSQSRTQSRSSQSQSQAQTQTGTSPQTFLENATANMQRGRYVDALADLNWLLKFEPNHLEALKQRSHLHMLRYDYQQAMADLTKAIALAPHHLTLCLQRGQIRLHLGDAHGTVTELSYLLAAEDIVTQDIDLAQVYYWRGQAHQQLNHMEEAIADFSDSLDIAPENAHCYQIRGDSYRIEGDFAQALANYRKAASLFMEQGNWSAHRTLQRQIRDLEPKVQAQQAEASRIVRVPIKHRWGGTPVIEVIFNGSVRFDMILDTGAAITCLPQQMAHLLNIVPTGTKHFRVADGRVVEKPVGFVNSITVGTAKSNNLQVSIAPNGADGLLGQNYLWRYDVRILQTDVELYRR
ncbi:MAG: tetratricopeptide repeat protein [Leptolyngbyaceae cyanobacterium]